MIDNRNAQAVYECIDKITQFVSKAAIFSFLPMLTWVRWCWIADNDYDDCDDQILIPALARVSDKHGTGSILQKQVDPHKIHIWNLIRKQDCNENKGSTRSPRSGSGPTGRITEATGVEIYRCTNTPTQNINDKDKRQELSRQRLTHFMILVKEDLIELSRMLISSGSTRGRRLFQQKDSLPWSERFSLLGRNRSRCFWGECFRDFDKGDYIL